MFLHQFDALTFSDNVKGGNTYRFQVLSPFQLFSFFYICHHIESPGNRWGKFAFHYFELTKSPPIWFEDLQKIRNSIFSICKKKKFYFCFQKSNRYPCTRILIHFYKWFNKYSNVYKNDNLRITKSQTTTFSTLSRQVQTQIYLTYTHIHEH